MNKLFNFGHRAEPQTLTPPQVDSPPIDSQQINDFVSNASPEQLDSIMKGFAAAGFPMTAIRAGEPTDPAANEDENQPAMAKANTPAKPDADAKPNGDEGTTPSDESDPFDFENGNYDFGGDDFGGGPEGEPEGDPEGEPETAPASGMSQNPKFSKAIDATQAVAMMLQGQEEIAGELHRQNQTIAAQREELKAHKETIDSQGQLIKSYTSGLAELIGRVEQALTAQGVRDEKILKAMVDVEENSQFIKAFRSGPAGHATNRNFNASTLPAGGTYMKGIQGTEPLSGALAGTAITGTGPVAPATDEEVPETRFGMNQRTFMKGIRACSTNEMEQAGVNLDRFFAIQNGGIPFNQIPESAFGLAASKLGMELQK